MTIYKILTLIKQVFTRPPHKPVVKISILKIAKPFTKKLQSSSSSSFEGIHSRSDSSRTGAKGLSLYYPRLLHCLNQMLAVVLLSQHRVSLSKTVRPRAPCGARCIGHAVSTWSAVCSEAPHSQFGEGASCNQVL